MVHNDHGQLLKLWVKNVKNFKNFKNFKNVMIVMMAIVIASRALLGLVFIDN